MQNSRRFIQTVRFVMLGSIVLYAWVIWRVPSSAIPNPILFRAITAMAVLLVVVICVMRRIQVLPAEASLALQPQDAKALARWRLGYVVTYALSEAIVLYGVALHFMGFSASSVAPFFVAGFALIAFFRPMTIPVDGFTSESGPGQNR